MQALSQLSYGPSCADVRFEVSVYNQKRAGLSITIYVAAGAAALH